MLTRPIALAAFVLALLLATRDDASAVPVRHSDEGSTVSASTGREHCPWTERALARICARKVLGN